MEILIFWVAFCFVAAIIAEKKGRSGVGFFFLSVVISPLLGVLFAIVVKPNDKSVERAKIASGDGRKCPFCAEIIKAEASVCRFCGRELPLRQAGQGKFELGGRVVPQRQQNPQLARNAQPERQSRKGALDIYLLVDGTQNGPYSLSEIQSMWNGGKIDDASLYWKEGMPEWRLVQEIL